MLISPAVADVLKHCHDEPEATLKGAPVHVLEKLRVNVPQVPLTQIVPISLRQRPAPLHANYSENSPNTSKQSPPDPN